MRIILLFIHSWSEYGSCYLDIFINKMKKELYILQHYTLLFKSKFTLTIF